MTLRRIALVLAAMFAILASQIPEFAQQYRQRLGGAIDELQRIVSQFDAEAAREGLTRDALIERAKTSASPRERAYGNDNQDSVRRLDNLQRQMNDFAQAGRFARVAVFLREFDAPLAHRTLDAFEPAMPVTAEGIVSGVAGFCFGLGFLAFFAWPFRHRAGFRLGRHRRSHLA